MHAESVSLKTALSKYFVKILHYSSIANVFNKHLMLVTDQYLKYM